MNGWQRLFVVLALLVTLPAIVFGISQKPDGSFYLYSCASPSHVTQAKAVQALASGNYREESWNEEPECLKALQRVASGAEGEERQRQWLRDLRNGAIALTIFFALVYALGWGLGWVWRGFFPKKPEAPR